ncbi:hypothetical protein ACN42_g11763, partial [Penicillium freii]
CLHRERSERKVRDGRWRVHSTTIIMCRFLMYGFMGYYRNGLIPHSLQSASVYSLEEAPA